jgi:hypothetical protein
MTSDSNDLEEQLRENLKLRRELVAEVAKAKRFRPALSEFIVITTAPDPDDRYVIRASGEEDRAPLARLK